MGSLDRLSPKIGLLDHLGHGNLGDDATLDAVMNNIKGRWPRAEFVGLTMDPQDTRRRHGIPSYAIRRYWRLPPQAGKPTLSEKGLKAKIKRRLSRYPSLLALLSKAKCQVVGRPKGFFQELSFLVESFSIVRNLDLLVISGGGQLLDSWGGPRAFPYTLFKWVLLARLARVKCYFINLGAGPFDYSFSKWLIRSALLFAEYVSFRDADSKAIIEEVGFKGKSEVSVDCVYGLDVPKPQTSPTRERAFVGFSPMAYRDPRVFWDKNQDAYDAYIRKLALFGSWLTQRHHHLTVFSTEMSFDSGAIEDLMLMLRKDNTISLPAITHKPVDGIEGLLGAMTSMDYVATCRYHGVIFAHLLNIPILAIAHHHKVATLMNDLGLSEYCVDIRAFDSDLLANTFVRIVKNRDDIKARMAYKAAHYRAVLSTQFDQLFPRPASARPAEEWVNEAL